ncbi:hypothetical protein RFM41_24600 [Mesorhizobium sp. VK25A]|uniref:Membrane-anchored ribosome-binding protein, inhibits growth in stationary phase, ElaB/YqjD/DUF883 family n=1 Tax=Mesorhizobium vachelliae TaxID=3072309 RepID=A0ABU5A9B8_9HYPH|nr:MULTISPECIES: hypothetical protein [unclassified Mesorhizobium]MDX8534308.1 hypothetical protein [Mesorhizobium sp. VK25D]MDX8546950.1 hypothetical protein [Mesorhizobium sp. VK25A]
MADNDTSTANSADGNAKTRAARSSSASRGSAASRGNTRAAKASEDAMKKQIAELKREVNRLNRALSEQAEEAAGTAHGWYRSAADSASNLYSGASDRASRAASQLRTQAHSVSETVQQNPGTFSTAMLIGGLVGLLAGMAISRSSDPEPDWLRRWHR